MTARELRDRLVELADQYKKQGNVWSPEVWIETKDGFMRVDRVTLEAGGIYIAAKEIGK